MGNALRRRGHAALAATAFLLLASCNTIWGISDADLDPARVSPDASAGSGGASGSAGAAGTPSDGGGGADTGAEDAPAGDADDGSAAGDGGSLEAADGEAGLSCEAGSGDCDGDPLTGCETDTTTSPYHCGACNAACDGFCKDSTCTAVTVIATDQYNPAYYGGIAFNDTDLFWVSSSDADQSVDKYRVQKCSKTLPATPTTLATNYSWLDKIMTGSQRVYFVGTAKARILYGMAFDGTGLSQELTNVYGMSWGSSRIYYASNYNGSAYLKYKNTLTNTETTVYSKTSPNWTSESVGGSMVAEGDYVSYVENSNSGYKIFLTSNTTAPTVTGTKSAGRIRKQGAALLWIEYPPTSTDDKLARYKNASNAPVTLTQGWRVNDLAFDHPNAYVSVMGGQAESYATALEVINVTNNTKRRLLVPSELRSLEIDNGYLYFFMSMRLVRISLAALPK